MSLVHRNHPSYAPPKPTSGDPLRLTDTPLTGAAFPAGRRGRLCAMRPYEGLLTAMVTPFHADGRVNEDAAVALAQHLLGQRLPRARRRGHDRRGRDADRRRAGPASSS